MADVPRGLSAGHSGEAIAHTLAPKNRPNSFGPIPLDAGGSDEAITRLRERACSKNTIRERTPKTLESYLTELAESGRASAVKRRFYGVGRQF